MAQVAKFKASKKAYLGHLSRVLTSLEEELGNAVKDMDAVQQLVQKVELKYAKVEELSNKIQEASEELNDIEAEVDSMDVLLDRVIEVKCKANAELKKVESAVDRSPKIEPEEDREARYKETIHLPKLNIDKYAGDIEEFREFMDIFQVSIHRNRRLTDVEKFMYLKSYLEGDAKELLEGLPRTDANYAFALELLEENYGNKEVLVNNHVSKLINLEKQDEKDSSSLRTLYNQITKHVRELETLGITAEMYSIFLVPIVQSKLSEDIRKTWARAKEKGIKKLLELIQIEVESAENSEQVVQAFKVEDSKDQKVTYSTPSKPWEKSYSKQSIPTVHALTIQTRSPTCVFCPGEYDHYADECRKAEKMPPIEVKSILMKENACLCCMKKGHRIVDCRKRRWLRCNKCDATNHHTLLHEDKEKATHEDKEQAVRSYATTGKKSTMLPQAKGRLIGPNGEQEEVNVLLDICSDKSFIRSTVARKLNLEGHMEEMSITGITGKTDEVKQRRVVSAVLKNRHHLEKYKTVEMVEVPEICTQFTRPAVSENVLNSKYLRHLQLADDYSQEKHEAVDVLIGLPSYWALVSGRVSRSKNNPIAMESTLGWVLVSDASNDEKIYNGKILSLFVSTQEVKDLVEDIGGEKRRNSGCNRKEDEVLRKCEEKIKYKEDKRYEAITPMIKRSDTSNNKGLSLRRYSDLKPRLKKKKDSTQKYSKPKKKYVDGRYLERVQEEEETTHCYHIHPRGVEAEAVSREVKKDLAATFRQKVIDKDSKLELEERKTDVQATQIIQKKLDESSELSKCGDGCLQEGRDKYQIEVSKWKPTKYKSINHPEEAWMKRKGRIHHAERSAGVEPYPANSSVVNLIIEEVHRKPCKGEVTDRSISEKKMKERS